MQAYSESVPTMITDDTEETAQTQQPGQIMSHETLLTMGVTEIVTETGIYTADMLTGEMTFINVDGTVFQVNDDFIQTTPVHDMAVGAALGTLGASATKMSGDNIKQYIQLDKQKHAILNNPGYRNAGSLNNAAIGLLGEIEMGKRLTAQAKNNPNFYIVPEPHHKLPGNQGFDIIQKNIKTGDIEINEVKSTSSYTKKVYPSKTQAGWQMSDSWITKNIEKMKNSPDIKIRLQGIELEEAYKAGKLKKSVSAFQFDRSTGHSFFLDSNRYGRTWNKTGVTKATTDMRTYSSTAVYGMKTLRTGGSVLSMVGGFYDGYDIYLQHEQDKLSGDYGRTKRKALKAGGSFAGGALATVVVLSLAGGPLTLLGAVVLGVTAGAAGSYGGHKAAEHVADRLEYAQDDDLAYERLFGDRPSAQTAPVNNASLFQFGLDLQTPTPSIFPEHSGAYYYNGQ